MVCSVEYGIMVDEPKLVEDKKLCDVYTKHKKN